MADSFLAGCAAKLNVTLVVVKFEPNTVSVSCSLQYESLVRLMTGSQANASGAAGL